jgi:hypothetical protein
MPDNLIPPPWREYLISAMTTLLCGFLGRLMFHARQVQAGRRRFFSLALAWELPVAIATGIIGKGIAEHFGLTGWQDTAAIVTVAYLGPGFVEAVVWKVVDRIVPAKGGTA